MKKLLSLIKVISKLKSKRFKLPFLFVFIISIFFLFRKEHYAFEHHVPFYNGEIAMVHVKASRNRAWIDLHHLGSIGGGSWEYDVTIYTHSLFTGVKQIITWHGDYEPEIIQKDLNGVYYLSTINQHVYRLDANWKKIDLSEMPAEFLYPNMSHFLTSEKNKQIDILGRLYSITADRKFFCDYYNNNIEISTIMSNDIELWRKHSCADMEYPFSEEEKVECVNRINQNILPKIEPYYCQFYNRGQVIDSN